MLLYGFNMVAQGFLSFKVFQALKCERHAAENPITAKRKVRGARRLAARLPSLCSIASLLPAFVCRDVHPRACSRVLR